LCTAAALLVATLEQLLLSLPTFKAIQPISSRRSHRFMNAPNHPRPPTREKVSALLLVAVLSSALGQATARADRFTVPTDSPPSSPSAPSSGDSGGSSSSGSPSAPSDSYSGGDRFIVPPPGGGNYASPSGGGGFSRGGGSRYYDPYWGGCYYWGGDYYFWGGHYYSTFHHRFGVYRDPHLYDYRSVPTANMQSPIFFPPAPPPLGAAIPPRPASITSIVAPADLAAYVYEPFYAPLSTRLSQADLTKKHLHRLETYRAARARLQDQLLKRLDELKDADPATRSAGLSALAATQADDLTKLEIDADNLRGDLLHGGLVGLFSGTGDWNERRRWRLGEGSLALPREQLVSVEFRVIRAAAFYQEGLSPEQRRLLREIEMELQVEAFKPKNATASVREETLLYFSPETARLPLPDDLPASLSLKIAEYEKDKTALKTELRDAIYSLDSTTATKRANGLQKLAESQADRFATLDALAEEIRVEFARLPNPPGPPTPPAFSPALSARITAYHTEKNTIQKTLQNRLDDVRKAHGKNAFSIVKKENPNPDSPTFRVEVPSSDKADAIMDAARKAIDSFNKEHASRLIALGKERDAIRVEVARFAADPQASAGKSVETLLNDFYANLQQGERWQHYRYYQIAMLQPGLSPAQRRLLFETALERLNLPLPAGEYPP
jgi:hypothetical protein